MFPIRDERGRMAGFGARILNPNDVPKFLNSPQTALFDKGRLLYGLDRARKQIRSVDQVVIVEGYLDVIALHQAGFANAVSPMGTALTEHQLYLLKRFTRRIVLALDPDAAGDKATLRGLQIARQAMDHEKDPVFDARGLLGYEARLQADIRVTTLPAGMDPDEVVNRDPKEWERILENARPIVIHVMETLAAQRDLDDPKGQERDRRPGAAADRRYRQPGRARYLPAEAGPPAACGRACLDGRGGALPAAASGGRRRKPAAQPAAAAQTGQAGAGAHAPIEPATPWKRTAWASCCAGPTCSTASTASLQEAGLARLGRRRFPALPTTSSCS